MNESKDEHYVVVESTTLGTFGQMLNYWRKRGYVVAAYSVIVQGEKMLRSAIMIRVSDPDDD